MVRCLRVARTTAAKARTQTANALRALVVTAPAELGEQLRDLPAARLASKAARMRPGPIATPTAATKLALRVLGQRYVALDAELAAVDAELDRLTAQAAPGLRQLCGIGPEIAGALLVAAGDNPGRLHSEAAFSMLCGASPIPASSGKTVRHRLNRGGTARPTRRCTGSWWFGCAGIRRPALTWSGGPKRAYPNGRSSGASSAMWPVRSSQPYRPRPPSLRSLDRLQERHSRDHGFETCHAHQHKRSSEPPPSPLLSANLSASHGEWRAVTHMSG
jgi:hypothetical protein